MSIGREPVAASSAPAVVSLDGVTCRFGDVTAVEDVSLQLPRGVLIGLVGPSGSGKTTIVRTMRGALTPAEGTVRVFGEDPRRLSGRNRNRLGYMPQLFTLYPDLTAEENVDFVASLYGMLFPRRRRRTKDVLHTVDLWEARGRRAEKLSGGMQRRLQLAATLVHDPDLLLLDEPTAGLDPLLRARVWEEVRRLKSEGATILVTTQYVGEAEECEVVALIVEGRLAALGSPVELRAQAMGGELVVVETETELPLSDWRAMPEVAAVTPIGPRRVRLTVSSAARALPALMEHLRSSDVSVIAASEERPSFDDVFATLVERVRRTGDTVEPTTADTAAIAAGGAAEEPSEPVEPTEAAEPANTTLRDDAPRPAPPVAADPAVAAEPPVVAQAPAAAFPPVGAEPPAPEARAPETPSVGAEAPIPGGPMPPQATAPEAIAPDPAMPANGATAADPEDLARLVSGVGAGSRPTPPERQP